MKWKRHTRVQRGLLCALNTKGGKKACATSYELADQRFLVTFGMQRNDNTEEVFGRTDLSLT